MKNITKKIGQGALTAMLITTVLASAACGPIGGQVQSGGEDIGGKQRITFSVYNGGTGTQWIEDMANV